MAETRPGVLADARGLIAGWDALEEHHVTDSNTYKGPLRIVASAVLGQLYFADIAIGFHVVNPTLSVNRHLQDKLIRFLESRILLQDQDCSC